MADSLTSPRWRAGWSDPRSTMREPYDNIPLVQAVSPPTRLDTHGAQALTDVLAACDLTRRPLLVLNLSGVSYVSSAGIRVLVSELKRRTAAGGRLVLAAPQPYVRDVLRMSGLEFAFRVEPTMDAALVALDVQVPGPGATDWAHGERTRGDWGAMTILPGSAAPAFVEIAGDITHVLASTLSPAAIVSKPFSRKAYSLGLGGLGARLEDYYHLMGEMMTIGGAMVWLPCDGHGLPDFLVPSNDTGQVMMRCGFNVSLAGAFNEYVQIEAAAPAGLTLSQIYRLLFDRARARRPDFRGVLGLAMRAEMPALFGAGVRRTPIVEQRPANGLPIIDASNFGDWFESDTSPRHRGVTGLIVGCGVDLTADHSAYSPDTFRQAFYLHPANRGTADAALHNHGVAFRAIDTDWTDVDLEDEIRRVLDTGEFLDMRHLLDASTVSRAVIGVIYVQDFRRDAEAVPRHR